MVPWSCLVPLKLQVAVQLRFVSVIHHALEPSDWSQVATCSSDKTLRVSCAPHPLSGSAFQSTADSLSCPQHGIIFFGHSCLGSHSLAIVGCKQVPLRDPCSVSHRQPCKQAARWPLFVSCL